MEQTLRPGFNTYARVIALISLSVLVFFTSLFRDLSSVGGFGLIGKLRS